jgi:CHAT domain-containing protein
MTTIEGSAYPHAPSPELEQRILDFSRHATENDELLVFLKAESERYLNVDPAAALQLAEMLIEAAELANRPDHQAIGRLAKGDALRSLGRYREAVPLFEAAAARFLALGDEVGWARSHIGWTWSMQRLGRGEEALARLDPAHAILIAHEEWLRAANLDVHAGLVCAEMGRYDQALELYQRAEETYRRLGDAGALGIAWAKQHRGLLLNRRGDFRAALALHLEARELFVRLGQTLNVRQQDRFVGYAYAGQGQYTRALHHYAEVLAAHDAAGQEAEAGWVTLDMSECYLGLNQPTAALEAAEDAAARFERCGAPTEVAKARLLAAVASTRIGDVGAALDALDESARGFEAAGLARELGIATLMRATLYLVDDGAAALAEAERADRLFVERGLDVLSAQARLVRARALVALGRADQAADLARDALATAWRREVPWLDHECHFVLARAAQDRGDLAVAREEYEEAVASIERLQSKLTTELRADFLGDKLQVYGAAIELGLELGDPGAALDYLERMKSRALVDYLVANPSVRTRAADARSQPLLDELARLRAEHAWCYARLHEYRLVASPKDALNEAERLALAAEVWDRERRIKRILERLALSDGGLAASPGRAGGRRAPWPPIEDGSLLVEYFLTATRALAFVVAGERLTVVPLEATSAAIARLLNLWQLNLGASAAALSAGQSLSALTRNAQGILAAMYRAVVQPLAPLLRDQERLIAIPYGPLHGLPFHALHDGQRFLLEQLEVTVCPSRTLLEICTRRPRLGPGAPATALVIGFSDGGRLPAVLAEARAVADLMGGECHLEAEATRSALVAGAARHRVLHLAAHGEARLDNPAFAHVKLADGQLSTVDVLNLDLGGALVTLSACESGRVTVTGGDELVGLSRGFLHAGASSIVQSLWRVEDGSTARLMERFYRGLAAGVGKGAALRAAQLASLDTGDPPYVWAPFELIGDGGPV